jgi:hypothetical protein
MTHELQSEKEDHQEILQNMKKPVTVFHTEVRKLRDTLVQYDSISVPQFRLLLLLSGAKLKDFFEMDKQHLIATPILPDNGISHAMCKQQIMENVEGKRRVVPIAQETFDPIGAQKKTGGSVTQSSSPDTVLTGGLKEGTAHFNTAYDNLITHTLSLHSVVLAGIILYGIPTGWSLATGVTKMFMRQYGIKKYWGKEEVLYYALEKYNLTRIMKKLKYEGHTSIESLKELDEYGLGILMERMRFKRRTKYGDEHVRFMDMLDTYDDYGDLIDDEDDDEDDDADDDDDDDEPVRTMTMKKEHARSTNTQKSKASTKGARKSILAPPTTEDEDEEDGDSSASVLPFYFIVTVPVMLAYYMRCSELSKSGNMPKAFGRLGNTTFANIYEHPEKYKTIISHDIHKDEKDTSYDGCLEGFDGELHTLFEEHGSDINKLRYKLLNRHEMQDSLHHRNILPLHMIRNTGEIRPSVNEMARALKYHYETSNLVGIVRSKLRTMFTTRKNKRSPSSHTQKTK